MTITRRIWIDQDSVVYDLSTPWYAAHNAEHPNHILLEKDVDGWDTAAVCKRAGCTADIYSYFTHEHVWSSGDVLGESQRITQLWQWDEIAQLGFLTTTPNDIAPNLKMRWLQTRFPHIRDIIITNGHLKHLVVGDILIDDGIHNLEQYPGVRILYDQPWNKQAIGLIRATGTTHVERWRHVDILVRKAIGLLNRGFTHRHVEALMLAEIDIALL